MTRRRLVGLAALAWTLAAGSAAAAPYAVTTIEDGGSIRGRVVFKGTPPPPEPQTVSRDHGVCGTQIPDERWLVGDRGAFANVVVVLEGIARGKAPKGDPVTLDNVGCRFVPHVSAFPKGTSLVLRNSDGILHSTHAYLTPVEGEQRTLFNLALPAPGIEIPKKIRDPGLVEVRCDAGHVWMRAWAWVSEHPYVAVTGADGTFTLDDVPAGSYALRAWHEAAGEKRAEAVQVRAGSATEVEIAFGSP